MNTADVLIIGGGVIGASVAYHLAVRGCTNIIVLERASKPGEGSTGKATGGFRCQFTTEVNVRLSLLSREKLLRFKDELDVDSGYRQYGYLFIAQNQQEMNAIRDAMKVQRQCGVKEVAEVSPEDIQRLNPYLSMNGIVGGTFCPTDGFIQPMNLLTGYTSAAQHLGVRFEFGVEVENLTLRKRDEFTSGIVEVSTSRGKFSADKVVNAAGAWAGVVARYAAADVPVTPLKRQVAVVDGEHMLPETLPMTVFVGNGFHFRVRDGRVLLLLPTDHPSYHSFDVNVDAGWVEEVRSCAQASVKKLEACTIDRRLSWAGLYEMSPDKHAIVGKTPGVDNLYLVNGSSGHGVMHSPALGEVLSQIIVDGSASSIDIHALRPSRFREGKANPMSGVL